MFVAAVFFWTVICLVQASCQDARLQPSISGAWSSVTYPSNYYIFHDEGLVEVHSVAGGIIVDVKTYAYSHNRETGSLSVKDRGGLFYFNGVVEFNPSGDTATLNPDGGLKIKISKW